MERCGEILQSKIAERIIISKCYSILAEKSTGISISKQFSFYIQYFNLEKCIIEDSFLDIQKLWIWLAKVWQIL
jgi:hypothetical protein